MLEEFPVGLVSHLGNVIPTQLIVKMLVRSIQPTNHPLHVAKQFIILEGTKFALAERLVDDFCIDLAGIELALLEGWMLVVIAVIGGGKERKDVVESWKAGEGADVFHCCRWSNESERRVETEAREGVGRDREATVAKSKDYLSR